MKKYFLLGASKGIGFGIAKELVKRNHQIFIGSRNKENLENAVKELNQIRSESVFYWTVDVNNYTSIEEWFNKGIAILNDIDGLLINYGGPPAGKFLDFHDKDWQHSFEFMLLNPIRLLRLVYPYLKNKKGSILIITSFAVKEPVENLILSNVFRSGITALIKTLSKEWAPNIRLNCLMPGRIDTDRIRQLDQKIAENQGKTEQQIRHFFENQIPLKRYGTIEEIGKVGAFLLSDDSSYITGSSIAVDGGIIHSLI
ncbi:MAG: short-chain dehydrogenase [Leptospiraceae bacterium]|nr:MAG: short-chain dehydrogenase [Leptospiraceae bacterium]